MGESGIVATAAQVYKFPLDDAHTAGYSEIAVETTAVGFGDLIVLGGRPPRAVFLRPLYHCAPFSTGGP